ncbi:MAG: pirin family protein [Pseudomonadota bacterium]
MLQIRKSDNRGHADHGWLNARHSFSFADYYDPENMGFRALRVINEDVIAPAQGFGTHPHRDMEIITYILEGELAHKDSMGNGRTIKAGEVQGMSAGSGITHSEFNASKENPCHLLQIWIMPHAKNVTPAYGESLPSGKKNEWQLVASEQGQGGAISIHQDAKLYLLVGDKDYTYPVNIAPDRFGWLQIAKGAAEMNGNKLSAGDGVAFSGGEVKEIRVESGSEILLFDLA